MNIINCFDCEYHYNTQYDVVGGLVMGLSEKSGWGLKFSTLEPPGLSFKLIYRFFLFGHVFVLHLIFLINKFVMQCIQTCVVVTKTRDRTGLRRDVPSRILKCGTRKGGAGVTRTFEHVLAYTRA